MGDGYCALTGAFTNPNFAPFRIFGLHGKGIAGSETHDEKPRKVHSGRRALLRNDDRAFVIQLATEKTSQSVRPLLRCLHAHLELLRVGRGRHPLANPRPSQSRFGTQPSPIDEL